MTKYKTDKRKEKKQKKIYFIRKEKESIAPKNPRR